MLDLAAAIRAANLTQEQWAELQGITKDAVQKLIKRGCKADSEGTVYRPTKYRVGEKK